MLAALHNDLAHLTDAKYQFTIEASGKYPEVTFEVLFQYSSHCVSWGPKEDQAIDFSTHGHDRRILDDKEIARCFCEIRYTLSHNLPDIFKTITERKCLFTGRQNWLIIEILDASGERQEYEVYFSLSRQSSNMLRIYVESAYVRDADSIEKRPAHLKRRDKVRAKTLLMKKLRNEPIKKPPNRNVGH